MIEKKAKAKKKVVAEEKTLAPADEKKNILNFLQKKSFDLRRSIPGLMDMYFEDDPPRVVVSVVSSKVKVPKLEHNGMEIAVELDVKTPVSTGPLSVTDDAPEGEFYSRSIAGEGAKILGIQEAIGPHTVTEADTKRAAYDAWVKRNSAVKISKG